MNTREIDQINHHPISSTLAPSIDLFFKHYHNKNYISLSLKHPMQKLMLFDSFYTC